MKRRNIRIIVGYFVFVIITFLASKILYFFINNDFQYLISGIVWVGLSILGLYFAQKNNPITCPHCGNKLIYKHKELSSYMKTVFDTYDGERFNERLECFYDVEYSTYCERCRKTIDKELVVETPIIDAEARYDIPIGILAFIVASSTIFIFIAAP